MELRQHTIDDLAVYVGETKVPPRISIGQAGVIEPQQVEDSGMKVMDAYRVLHGMIAELVGRAIPETGLYSPAGHPEGKTLGMMPPTSAVLDFRRASKFLSLIHI